MSKYRSRSVTKLTVYPDFLVYMDKRSIQSDRFGQMIQKQGLDRMKEMPGGG